MHRSSEELNLHQKTPNFIHCANKELISFRQSRSKVDQDIGRSSKIHYCEIRHFQTVYAFNV